MNDPLLGEPLQGTVQGDPVDPTADPFLDIAMGQRTALLQKETEDTSTGLRNTEPVTPEGTKDLTL
jgi:hypothetical protein